MFPEFLRPSNPSSSYIGQQLVEKGSHLSGLYETRHVPAVRIVYGKNNFKGARQSNKTRYYYFTVNSCFSKFIHKKKKKNMLTHILLAARNQQNCTPKKVSIALYRY